MAEKHGPPGWTLLLALVVVVLLALGVPWMGWAYMGTSAGMGAMMRLFMLAIMVLPLVLLALLVIMLVRRPVGKVHGARGELDARYARGELDRDRYLEMREDLERR